MPGPIDISLERHRRDRDPHPFLKERLDDLQAEVDALTVSGGAAVGNDPATPVLPASIGTAGTASTAARSDHTHAFDPDQAGVATATDLAAEIAARIAGDDDLDARKINIGTGIDAQRVLVGEDTTTAGGDPGLTWSPATVESWNTATVDFGSTYLASSDSGAPVWSPGIQSVPYQGTSGTTATNGTFTGDHWWQYTEVDGLFTKVVEIYLDGATATVFVAVFRTTTPGTACWVSWTQNTGDPDGTYGGAFTSSGIIGASTWPSTITVSGAYTPLSNGLLNAEGTVDANTLRGDDMAGTGERVAVAQADGTLRDVDEMDWDGTRLSIIGVLRVRSSGSSSGWTFADRASTPGYQGEFSCDYPAASLGANGPVLNIYNKQSTDAVPNAPQFALWPGLYGSLQAAYRAVVVGGAVWSQQRLDYFSGSLTRGGWEWLDQGTQRAALTAAGAWKVNGQAGTGERVVIAGADGTQRDVDQITWDGQLLEVETSLGNYIGFRAKNTSSGANASASWYSENDTGANAVSECYGSANGGTLGGVSRNNGASFIGTGPTCGAVFYGLHSGTSGRIVHFIHGTNYEARYTDTGGWEFRQQIQVTEDAGTGNRAVFAQADGHHAPNADVVATGSGATAKVAINSRTVGVRYRHVQGSASTTWVIVHNLDEYPSVTVVDSSGNVCLGDVRYDSTNQITITFGAAFAGNAYLN